MTRSNNREHGVTVRVVDMAPLEEETFAWVQEKRLDLVDKGISSLRVGFAPWGVFEDALGNTVLVCNEGVAYYVMEDHPAEVPVYAEYDKGDSKMISMMPLGEVKVDPDYIQHHRTDEVLDLADFIRSFGSRLESNFHAVRNLATNTEAAREAAEGWRSDSQTHV